jgi:hypothetical protein
MTNVSRADLLPAAGYPRADRGRVVIWGLLGGYAFGGMSWQALHYIAGLRRLGFDVWYVEDSGHIMSMDTMDWAYDPQPNVRYLAAQMDRIGMADRWLYRPYGNRGEWFGNTRAMSAGRLYRDSDAIFNVCGFRWVAPAEEFGAPLIYIDTDPGERQVDVATGDAGRIEELDRYALLSTYAENIGSEPCGLPVDRYEWVPTRPPVITDWWLAPPPAGRAPITTISHWYGSPHKTLEWEGQSFEWRKDQLFRRYLELPARSPWPLELALRGFDDWVRDDLTDRGWRVATAGQIDPPDLYRGYIRASAGEFTIAKAQYTQLRTGWFSDRSVCYLAAGRPVVTEDTGFSRNLPCGDGLFAFADTDGALAALEAINADYAHHAKAAAEIGREYFGADRVLADLCKKAGLL